MRRRLPDLKVERFELMFIRFLHLLAHHPDFDDTHEALCDIAKQVFTYSSPSDRHSTDRCDSLAGTSSTMFTSSQTQRISACSITSRNARSPCATPKAKRTARCVRPCCPGTGIQVDDCTDRICIGRVSSRRRP